MLAGLVSSTPSPWLVNSHLSMFSSGLFIVSDSMVIFSLYKDSSHWVSIHPHLALITSFQDSISKYSHILRK